MLLSLDLGGWGNRERSSRQDEQRARRVPDEVTGHAAVHQPAGWAVATGADDEQVQILAELDQLLPWPTVGDHAVHVLMARQALGVAVNQLVYGARPVGGDGLLLAHVLERDHPQHVDLASVAARYLARSGQARSLSGEAS